MDLNAAKSSFQNIICALNNQDRSQFLAWCEETYSEANYSRSYFDLRVIAEDIKTMIPLEAVLPSENVDHSHIENSSGICKPVLHIDSFLFEGEHIDALEEEGKIKRNYCQKCGSFDIAPITFVSHSMSIKRIQYIFQTLLPDLTGKTVLDVGSRLGAVLYGAYHCSSAQKIIGVEMNEDLCKLQKHIVDKYNMNDRIQVICSDICNVPDIVKSANIIIFNNVFQCFTSLEMQQKIWQWLRTTITNAGTAIITIPSLEETFGTLKTGIDISSWLREVPVASKLMDDDENTDDPDLVSETFLYVVL